MLIRFLRRWLFLGSITLFSLLATLLLLEGGVRLVRAAPPAQPAVWLWRAPDAITGWSLAPSIQGRYYNPLYEFDVPVAINSRGMRAAESVGYEKLAGVYRILILGDSFVAANQVAESDRMGSQLADLIQDRRQQPVEVLAMGVDGWGTDQELLWLREEGVKYSPDLILLAVYPRNDFMNNSQALETANMGQNSKPFFHLDGGRLVLENFPFDPAQARPVQTDAPVEQPQPEPGPLTTTGEWLHGHSALYRYADPRLRIAVPRVAARLARTGLIKPGQESKIVAQGADYVPLAYHVYGATPAAEWQEAFHLTQALFAEVKQTAAAMGAESAALLLGAPEEVIPGRWDEILRTYPAMQDQTWSLTAPRAQALDLLQQAGLPALDLAPLFAHQAAAGASLHFADDGHWTPAGHTLAAAQIFNFLSQSPLTPSLHGDPLPLPSVTRNRSLWDWFVLLILFLLVISLVWSVVQDGPVAWGRSVGARLSTAGELVFYVGRTRQFLLLPLVIILLLFGGLLIVAQASVVGPFIYTLF